MSLSKTSSCRYNGFEYQYKLDYCANGNTIPTVLLGGVLQDMYSWKNYVAEFSKTNTVLTIDLPGVGGGGVLSHEFGFDFLADCLNAVLEQERITSINIFSTSYSTIVAHEFAKRHGQKINRLVLSATMTAIPPKQKKTMLNCIDALSNNRKDKFLDEFMDGVANQEVISPNRELVLRVMRKGILEMTQIQVEQFIQNTLRVLTYKSTDEHTGLLKTRPLIFTGEFDSFTPPELCIQLGERYTTFEFTIIPGLDHFFHIGNNRLLFGLLVPYFNADGIEQLRFVQNVPAKEYMVS